MTHVIALSGYAGVGKDTVARLLQVQHGYHRLAFADRLRDLVLKIDPVVGIDKDANGVYLSEIVKVLGWDGAKRMYLEVREMLQDVGNGAREVLGQTVWIEPVVKAARNFEHVVISDVRYQNEIDVLRAGRFTTVVSVRLERSGVGPVNDHVSETGRPSVDHIHTLPTGVKLMPESVDTMMASIKAIQMRKIAGRYDHILAKLTTADVFK